MKTNNLLLVGGGFIAGYVVCKLMNRNSENENFSANGVQRGYAGQQFKFNGKGRVLQRRTAGGNWIGGIMSQRYLNTPITLTGNSKKLQLSNDPYLASNQQYEESSSPNAIEYLESTLIISVPTTSSSGQITGNSLRKIWFPKESVVRI